MRPTKKITALILLLTCSLMLFACGKEDKNEGSLTASNETTNNSKDETTMEPVTQAPTTEAPTQDPVQTWIDSVYADLIAGNNAAVIAAVKNYANISDICASYLDADWSYDNLRPEYAFRLTTSEGKHLGIICYRPAPDSTNESDEISVIASEDESHDYGFEYTGYNDTELSYDYYPDGQSVIILTLINNNYTLYDSTTGEVEYEDKAITEDFYGSVWHA